MNYTSDQIFLQRLLFPLLRWPFFLVIGVQRPFFWCHHFPLVTRFNLRQPPRDITLASLHFLPCKLLMHLISSMWRVLLEVLQSFVECGNSVTDDSVVFICSISASEDQLVPDIRNDLLQRFEVWVKMSVLNRSGLLNNSPLNFTRTESSAWNNMSTV